MRAAFGGRLQRDGILGAAREAFTRALSLAQECDDRATQAKCLYELGGVALEVSDFSTATRCYERSAEICQELGDREAYAQRLYHAGVAFSAMGHHAQAEALFAEAVEIADRTPDFPLARTLNYLHGLLHYRPDEALGLRYMEALGSLLQDGVWHAQTMDEAILAINVSAVCESDKAEALLHSAAEFFRQHSPHWEAQALQRLAAVRLNMNRLEGARDAAVSALLQVQHDRPYDTLHVYELLADVYQRNNQPMQATEALQKAVSYGEQIRSALVVDETRKAFAQKLDHIYRRIVTLLVKLGRPEDALTYAERTNARVLAEQLTDVRPPPKVPAGSAAQAYSERRAALDQLWAKALRREVSRDAFESRRIELQRALDEATDELFRMDPEYGQHLTGLPPDWHQVRSQLAAGQAIVHALLVIDGWVLFVVTAVDVHAVYVPGEPNELARLSRSLWASMRRAVEEFAERKLANMGENEPTPEPAMLQLSQELYRRLFAPLDNRLADVTEIVWVPDYLLLDLPVAALHDERCFLTERFTVTR